MVMMGELVVKRERGKVMGGSWTRQEDEAMKNGWERELKKEV